MSVVATATYEYKVRDRKGAMKTGKLDAETEAQVVGRLKAMGYAPISITTAKAPASWTASASSRTRLPVSPRPCTR